MNKYHIPPNGSNPRKYYDVSDEETLFLDALLERSKTLKGEYQLSRLSNGTVNVSYNGYAVGKIKLQGRNKYMSVLTNLYDSETINGELPDLINAIGSWISYIKTFLLNEA